MKPLLIDTNLLLLWVAAKADPSLVGQAKILDEFRAEDVGVFNQKVMRHRPCLVTPGVISETSSFIENSKGYWGGILFAALRGLIGSHVEVWFEHVNVLSDGLIADFGAVDLMLLYTAKQSSAELLTVDGRLVKLALDRGIDATNFNYLRPY